MSDGPKPKDYRYLTVIQKRYYDFIRAYIKKYDIAPSAREIAQQFKVNPSTAQRMVETLVRAGALYRSPRVARSIRPLQLLHKEVREYKVAFSGFAKDRNFETNGVSEATVKGDKSQ